VETPIIPTPTNHYLPQSRNVKSEKRNVKQQRKRIKGERNNVEVVPKLLLLKDPIRALTKGLLVRKKILLGRKMRSF